MSKSDRLRSASQLGADLSNLEDFPKLYAGNLNQLKSPGTNLRLVFLRLTVGRDPRINPIQKRRLKSHTDSSLHRFSSIICVCAIMVDTSATQMFYFYIISRCPVATGSSLLLFLLSPLLPGQSLLTHKATDPGVPPISKSCCHRRYIYIYILLDNLALASLSCLPPGSKMLSFISMGGRKNRVRRSGSGKHSQKTPFNTRGRHNGRRVSRDSMSFASPGDIGKIVDQPSYTQVRAPVQNAIPASNNLNSSVLSERGQHLPEIDLDLGLDPLQKSLPKEYLQNNVSSSPENYAFGQSPSQASRSNSILSGSPQENRALFDRSRRMGPLPTVTPLQIPSTPVRIVPTQIQKRSSRTRVRRSRSLTPHSGQRVSASWAWASDSEASPVSGISAAREVITKSFSFSARATAFGNDVSDIGVGTSSGSNRPLRQDSATLPRDGLWDIVDTCFTSLPLSRKNSSNSSKRKRGTRESDKDISNEQTTSTVPAPIKPSVFLIRHPGTEVTEDPKYNYEEKAVKESLSAPPLPNASLRRINLRNVPTDGFMNSSTQASIQLHRISRITEGDAEQTSASLSPPASSSIYSTPDSGSISTGDKSRVKGKGEEKILGSPFTSVSALSSPSKYSKYTQSPDLRSIQASPGNFTNRKNGKTEWVKEKTSYDSLFEDSQLQNYVSSSSISSPRRHGSSRRKGSVFGDEVTSFMKPKLDQSDESQSLQADVDIKERKGTYDEVHRLSRSSPNTSVNETQMKYQFPPPEERLVLHNRSDSNSSISSSAGSPRVISRNKPVPLAMLAPKSNVPVIRESIVRDGPIIPITRLPIGDNRSIRMLNADATSSEISTSNEDPEKRKPTLSLLSVSNACPITTNPGLSPSSASATTPSTRSPDLLDILIPNGHIVASISSRGRKRSASTPSPIVIQPHRDPRYQPTNGDDEIYGDENCNRDAVTDKGGACLSPKHGNHLVSHTEQTFPETPVLFSPDFMEASLPLSGREGILTRANSTVAGLRFTRLASSTRRNLTLNSPHRPITIPETPKMPSSPILHGNRNTSGVEYTNPRDTLKLELRLTCPISPSSVVSSPPISPFEPPNVSLVTSTPPSIQVALEKGPPTPPLLAPAPAPRRRTVLIRPPLPYGPRKLSTTSSSRFSGITTSLVYATRRTVSEGKVGLDHVSGIITPEKAGSAKEASPNTSSSALSAPTPTFKTSPIAWRGLTLDAAKWTMSSCQLQDIVKFAIEQSAQPTAIRLLSQDVIDKEIPIALERLQMRRADVQKDYKVLVRRRQAILQRLVSISPGSPRSGTESVIRDAEELAELAVACDRLTEELHGIDDQITQITHLKDVHQSSALAMALRKLNTSLIKQTAATRELQVELANLYEERDEAWKKAEELEQELDAMHEESPISSVRAVKSVASSRRSSRVSVSLARKGSARRTSLRSSISSFHAHHSASGRIIFGLESIPPVPPMPTLEGSNGGTFLSISSDSCTPRLQCGPSPGIPSGLSTSEGLYHAVYDLLGVNSSERPTSPGRPHSAVYHSNNNAFQKVARQGANCRLTVPEQPLRMRSGSLPSSNIPPQKEPREDDTNAIIANLRF